MRAELGSIATRSDLHHYRRDETRTTRKQRVFTGFHDASGIARSPRQGRRTRSNRTTVRNFHSSVAGNSERQRRNPALGAVRARLARRTKNLSYGCPILAAGKGGILPLRESAEPPGSCLEAPSSRNLTRVGLRILQLASFRLFRCPGINPEIQGQPQTVRRLHENQRQKNGEQEPERELGILRGNPDARQKQRQQKGRYENKSRQDVGDDHASQEIAGLAEVGKPADRALRQHAIQPSAKNPSLVAVGTPPPHSVEQRPSQ